MTVFQIIHAPSAYTIHQLIPHESPSNGLKQWTTMLEPFLLKRATTFAKKEASRRPSKDVVHSTICLDAVIAVVVFCTFQQIVRSYSKFKRLLYRIAHDRQLDLQ